MARLLLVRPGAGAPEVCSLEVWQAVTGRTVAAAPGDPFAARLAEAGINAIEVPEAEAAPATPAPKRSLNLIGGPHAHDQTSPALAALAGRLASLAARHGEIAFILPSEQDAIVRAVFERALAGDVEVEVVVGRAPRGHRLLDVVATMARLRGPGGCPWDAQQTHATLARYVLDETYELLHAIEEGMPADIADELGDLLLQVVFHAQMGTDAATFDIDDVADLLVRKLVRRHPHVFADVAVEGAEEVVANWDVIKEHERPRSSVHDDIPESLPALAWAAKLQRRAGKAGFDWDDAGGPLQKVREELAELERAGDDEREAELGDLLLAVVALSRHLGIDAESALRRSARRFRSRVAVLEDAAKAQGVALRDLTEDRLAELWDQAKAIERD